MFRLLTLLAAALFLTMLIGGRDEGQMRAGLMPQPERRAPVQPVVREEPEAIVTLAAVTRAPAPTPVPAVASTLPEPEPLPVAVAAPDIEPLPVRWVDAQAINVRQGPSTGNPVIGRLTRGEAVSVVAEAADGWVLIRIEGDGVEGYVAARLLVEDNPGG